MLCTGSMHSFASGRRPVDLVQLGVCKGHAVLFSYGEIDVRTHLGRLRDLRLITSGGADCDAVGKVLIEDLVTLYIKAVVSHRDFFDMDVPIVVLSVPPPSDQLPNPKVMMLLGRLFCRATSSTCITTRCLSMAV
jgi:hypothetical protein